MNNWNEKYECPQCGEQYTPSEAEQLDLERHPSSSDQTCVRCGCEHPVWDAYARLMDDQV